MNTMKNFFLLLFCVISFENNAHSAITYKKNGGRFGDEIISYYRAKWLSLQYNIPLLYKPMRHGKDLVVNEKELHYSKDLEKTFDKVVQLSHVKNPQLDPNANILYVIDWTVKVSARWNDREFLSLMKSMIAPNYEVSYVKKPDDAVSVAIHVRTGGGYTVDTAREKQRNPLRFPPFKFYINELRRIIQMYPDQKLYVHIFTDHQQPKRIVNHFKFKMKCDDIIYGCREEGNRHDANVLDDFFNMMTFDIFIFPRSGLSTFAHKLGDQKVGITPVDCKFVTKKVWDITKICVLKRDENNIIRKKIIKSVEG